MTRKTALSAKKLWECVYKAGYDTVMQDGIEHAGYLAFLSILSLFPFLVFMVAITGFIGELPVGQKFIEVVIGTLPEDFIAALKPRLQEIVSGPPQGLMTIAILGAIWTASSAVEGTRTILNRAYRVQTPPAYIWRRLMSIAQFFILTVCSIIAMFLIIFAPTLWDQIHVRMEVQVALEPFWDFARYWGSGLILFLVVATSYYILPNIKQRWRDVTPGALLVLALWLLAAELFAGYVRNFEQVNLIYGSLGGIIIALLFFYIIAVIYIFGAEFNYHFERATGHKIIPKEKV